MKRIKGIVCGLLLVLMMNLSVVPAYAKPNENSNNKDIFTTDITTSDSQVIFSIGIKENAGITSGKIVVSYDESMLTVSSASGNNIWEMEDVNIAATKDDKKAVSFAWADSEAENEAGTMFTVTFQGTDAAAGEKVSIVTDVVELYNGDEAVTVPTTSEKSTVKLPKKDKKEDIAKKIIQQIHEVVEGSQVTVSITGEDSVISGEVFAEIKGKNITLKFQLGNGVIWLINGQDIKNPKEIDLNVSLATSNIPTNVISAVGDDKIKSELQFSLAFDGEFGTDVTMMIPLGEEAVGYFANLYYYNPTTGQLEFMSSSKVGEGGNCECRLTHASDYIIIVSENDGAQLANKVEAGKTEGGNSTVQINGTVAGVESNTLPATKVEAKDTGDKANVAGYILLFGGIAVLIAAVVAKKMKHNKNA